MFVSKSEREVCSNFDGALLLCPAPSSSSSHIWSIWLLHLHKPLLICLQTIAERERLYKEAEEEKEREKERKEVRAVSANSSKYAYSLYCQSPVTTCECILLLSWICVLTLHHKAALPEQCILSANLAATYAKHLHVSMLACLSLMPPPLVNLIVHISWQGHALCQMLASG